MKSIPYLIFSICLVLVKDIGIDCQINPYKLNREDICAKKWVNFKVMVAFKVNSWVGIAGQFFTTNEKEETEGSIKAFYHPFKDPSERTEYEFFSANVFEDLQKYTVKRNQHKSTLSDIDGRLKFAFTVKDIDEKLLDNQRSNELVFIGYNKQFDGKLVVWHTSNTTDVLEFAIQKSSDSNSLSLMKLLGEKTVYQMIPNPYKTFPYDDEDNSKMLNLKLLYLHFPDGVTIKGVIIMNLVGKDGKNNFYAIVYTEEKPSHFYRHFLRSKLVSNEKYRVLEWEWDDRTGQCHETKNVDTVMLLSVETTKATASGSGEEPDSDSTVFAIKLIEFFGHNHDYVELEIDDKVWNVTEKKRIQRNNAKVFLHCDKHPEFDDPNKVACASEDSVINQNVEEDDTLEMASNQRLQQEYYGSWLVFGVIIGLMGIIILIAFAVFTFVESNPND